MPRFIVEWTTGAAERTHLVGRRMEGRVAALMIVLPVSRIVLFRPLVDRVLIRDRDTQT